MARSPARRNEPAVEVPKVREVQAPPVVPEVALPQPAPVYKFWNKARCPRCGGVDTEAYGTHGPIQYRRCRGAVCRWTFTVTGKEA